MTPTSHVSISDFSGKTTEHLQDDDLQSVSRTGSVHGSCWSHITCDKQTCAWIYLQTCMIRAHTTLWCLSLNLVVRRRGTLPEFISYLVTQRPTTGFTLGHHNVTLGSTTIPKRQYVKPFGRG